MEDEWMEHDRLEEDEIKEFAWDDVNDVELPTETVREARKEKMGYMKNKTRKVAKESEAYRVTGKPPISTKWVDTDKSHGVGEMIVRSRWWLETSRRGVRRTEGTSSARPLPWSLSGTSFRGRQRTGRTVVRGRPYIEMLRRLT